MKAAAHSGDDALRPAAREQAREIEDELRFHLDSLTDEYRAQGYPLDRALQAARERFGDPGEVRRQCLILALREGHLMRTTVIVLAVLLTMSGAGAALLVMRARQAEAAALRERAVAVAAERAAHEAALRAEKDGMGVRGQRKVLTVDEALESAARHVESALGDQPELAARLREVILRVKDEPGGR